MKERFMIHADVEDILNRLNTNEYRKYAVAVSRNWVEKSAQFASNKIFCFNRANNIQNYSVSINIRKGFPYIAEVNEIIRNALEAGLIVKWEHDGQSLKSLDDLNDFTSNPNSQLNDIMLLAVGLSIIALAIAAEAIMNNRVDSLNHYNLSMFVHKLFNTSVYTLR